jgi:hypothetical protein
MLIKDIVGEGTPQIYGKYKQSLKRRYRCQTGPRKGRIVADPATCSAPINIKKKQQMKATRAKRSTIQGKLSSYTKKYNPTSKIVKKLNTQVIKRRQPKMKALKPIKLGKR